MRLAFAILAVVLLSATVPVQCNKKKETDDIIELESDEEIVQQKHKKNKKTKQNSVGDNIPLEHETKKKIEKSIELESAEDTDTVESKKEKKIEKLTDDHPVEVVPVESEEIRAFHSSIELENPEGAVPIEVEDSEKSEKSIHSLKRGHQKKHHGEHAEENNSSTKLRHAPNRIIDQNQSTKNNMDAKASKTTLSLAESPATSPTTSSAPAQSKGGKTSSPVIKKTVRL